MGDYLRRNALVNKKILNPNEVAARGEASNIKKNNNVLPKNKKKKEQGGFFYGLKTNSCNFGNFGSILGNYANLERHSPACLILFASFAFSLTPHTLFRFGFLSPFFLHPPCHSIEHADKKQAS